MEVLIHLENGQTVVAEIHKHDKDGFVYLRPYATVEGRDISLMPAEPGAYRHGVGPSRVYSGRPGIPGAAD